MRKILWTLLVLVLLGAAGWKTADFIAAKEAAERQHQQEEETKQNEAHQQEIDQQRETKRAAYVDLVSKAAFGRLASNQRTDLETIGFNEQKQRLIAICSAPTSDIHNSHLLSIWSDIRRHAERGLLVLYRIDILDQSKPAGWDIIASFPKDKNRDTFWHGLTEQIDKTELQKQFRDNEAIMNRSIGDLAQTVSDLPLPDAGQTLKITYLPSWRGVFAAEMMQVKNTSAVDLQHTIVFVTITSKTGTTLVHLHYVDNWLAGAALAAQYLHDPSDYVNTQTVDQPETVEVLAVSPSGLNRGTYQLNQQEWDTRVKDYLGKVAFQGDYLPPSVEEATGQHLGPGFQFSFTGLRMLPVRAARVRFIKAGQSEDITWNLTAIEPGKPYIVHSTSTAEPDTAELTLWFEDTNMTVTIPSGSKTPVIAQDTPTQSR
jgi:hypothetical protein